MKARTITHYQYIATAIELLHKQGQSSPNLDEVAKKMDLSSSDFQGLISEWAGTSPKHFTELISPIHTKRLLSDKQLTLFDSELEADSWQIVQASEHQIKLIAMTPEEYNNGGENLKITYSLESSPFGLLIIASTPKGICHMAFEETETAAVNNLKHKFPNADFDEKSNEFHLNALRVFQEDWTSVNEINLHLKGTDFQLDVWNCLLNIPLGKLTTYGKIAHEIGNPKASRAVGTAIGSNPIAYLIPCHRVVQSTGVFGGYRWGTTRKTAMIGWEGARTEVER